MGHFFHDQKSNIIFLKSKHVFRNLFGESLQALSIFKVTKSLFHLELPFVLYKIRNCRIFCAPIQVHLLFSRPNTDTHCEKPISITFLIYFQGNQCATLSKQIQLNSRNISQVLPLLHADHYSVSFQQNVSMLVQIFYNVDT